MVVAATKLTIPRSRRTLVPRPDLWARLDGDYRVGLVSAPAGYGKTATLAAWAAEQGDRLAWLSCDSSDAEPTRFMAGLLSAVGARWPGSADDAFVLLDRDGTNTIDAAVSVANELAAVATAGVIVVDDLHLAAPAPAILTAFIDALPPSFRFVAGTRVDPPLSLARLRVHGDLLELRSADLRFEGPEVSDFFRLHDVDMAGADVRRLHELTEGWPAGVQLAAIALQRGAERDTFLDAFASTDRAMADFLLSEVLASLPPDVVDFLVRTSVLESFDAQLCREVTGADDAGAVLDRLVGANLFVVPLDDRGRWYRYHHLFAAFLRARLASLDDAQRGAAHDRASRALEARGDIAAALQHAMTTGDVERAGYILRAAIDRSMSMSDGADTAARALRLWLHEYGPTFIETDPIGVVEFLIGLTTLAGPDDVPVVARSCRASAPGRRPRADRAHRGRLRGAPPAPRTTAGGAPAPRPGDGGDRRTPARGRPPPAGARRDRARRDRRRRPRASRRDHRAGPRPYPWAAQSGIVVRHPVLGAARRRPLRGELSHAVELATRARRAADEIGLGHHDPGRIFAGLALLEVHLARHEDDAALQRLDELGPASEATHRLTLQATVAFHQARAACSFGDAVAAVAHLEQVRLAFVAPDAALRHVLAEEAALQALVFEPAQASGLIDALDQDRATTAVLRACWRCWTATTDRRAPRWPRWSHRRHDAAASNEACSARWLSSTGTRSTPRRTFASRSASAQPERMIRAIVEQGPDVHRLLKSFTPAAAEEPFVERLLAVAERVVAPLRATVPAVLVEPLSEREVTVLRYLCSRLTNLEIAAALYVSPNTLKSHVRSVYRKLGVDSRADAVATGRRLRVI